MNSEDIKTTITACDKLASDLASAEAIKAEMTLLLRELEQTASGKISQKVGGWRQHPKKWSESNLN